MGLFWKLLTNFAKKGPSQVFDLVLNNMVYFQELLIKIIITWIIER